MGDSRRGGVEDMSGHVRRCQESTQRHPQHATKHRHRESASERQTMREGEGGDGRARHGRTRHGGARTSARTCTHTHTHTPPFFFLLVDEVLSLLELQFAVAQKETTRSHRKRREGATESERDSGATERDKQSRRHRKRPFSSNNTLFPFLFFEY